MKPQTYMNRSGESVADACRHLGLDPERLVVVLDDIDLPLGRIRVRRGGGTGGHNGIRSIIDETGESGFVRVRIGVGRPVDATPVEQFVLEPFAESDACTVDEAVARAASAVCTVIAEGVEPAMQKFNAAPPSPGA